MADRYVTVYNSTDRPVLVDSEGRTLGGGEYGTVVRRADEVRTAIDAGLLVVQDAHEGQELSDEARKAHDSTREANAERETSTRSRRRSSGDEQASDQQQTESKGA